MSSEIHDLGENKISTLFAQMSGPIIIGLVINGLYNVVDSIFVTRGVGSLGMGGVSVVFPLQMITYAVAIMIGSGAASFISRYLGANESDEANHIAGNAIMLCLVFSFSLSIAGLLYLKPILNFVGATTHIYPYAHEYAFPIIYAFPIMMLSTLFNEFLRAEGKMKAMSLILVLGSALNIILDAIFILGLEMGVFGASIATIIAQTCALVAALYLYMMQKTDVQLLLKNIRFNLVQIRNILILGVPVFMVNLGVAVSISFVNYSLVTFGGINADKLISAYGLNTRITFFGILPLIGMMVAFQTLAGFNFGAKKFHRVSNSVKIACLVTSLYSLGFTLMMLMFPEHIFSIFTDDQVLLKDSIEISRIIFLGFVTMGIGFISGAFFQAIGKAKPALFLSTFRMFILFIPLIIILPMWYGVPGIWLAFPISDFIAVIICSLFLVKKSSEINLKAGHNLPNITCPSQ